MSDRPTEKDKSLPLMGDETDYYQRINVMLVDLGTDTLLRLFKSLVPDGDAISFLKGQSGEIKKILSKDQCRRILNDTLVETDLDIAILIKLMLKLLPQKLKQVQKSSKNQPLAGDLQILIRIRNDLVGHRSAAKITKETFIDKWDTISVILKRILPSSESKEELDERIKYYKTCKLAPETVKKILDKLEEQINLLKQVKELGKQMEEFKLFEKLPEQYKAYVILLCDGGKLVLRCVLHREMEKKKYTFDKLVQENLKKFPSLLSSAMQLSSLDISVLTEIILTFFGDSISESDKTRIEFIRDERYSYADSCRLSLDDNKFRAKWTTLIRSLDNLLTNIDENSKTEYEEILQKCTDGHFSDVKVDECLNQLKAEGMNVMTLEEVYADMSSEAKTLFEKMEEADLPLKEEVHLRFLVRCQSPGAKRSVEKELKAHFQKHISGSVAKENQNELVKLVDEIEGQDGVTITGVYTKCIIIVLHLPTYRATNYLINCVESQHFGRLIEHLSRTLSLEYMEAISIQARLTFESMAQLSNHKKQQSKRHLTNENLQDFVSKRTKNELSVTPHNGRIITTERDICV